MKKRGLLIIVVLLAVFLILQAIRPQIKTAPVTAEVNVPDSVKNVLRKSCYDCHSNEPNLRWYDHVAPAYWKVAADVNEGRSLLNFSEWDKLAKPEQQAKLWEALNQVIAGAMPLNSYTAVHPSAKLTDADIRVIMNYLLATVKPLHYDPKADSAADKQFGLWTGKAFSTGKAPVALNGIAFDPDYKNWQVVTTSERFDNGTMRLILGNPVAMAAIKNNQVSPWPDGAKFAKVAYAQKVDKAGNISAGEFKRIEFMVKNADKYTSTGGWGFARFKTTKLMPYGKTAIFATECINCHRPEEKTDFVFTQPIRIYQ